MQRELTHHGCTAEFIVDYDHADKTCNQNNNSTDVIYLGTLFALGPLLLPYIQDTQIARVYIIVRIKFH